MNVYEAIEASPIGVAWHEVGKQTICKHESCRWSDKNFPDGWQPLAVLEQYTLGEPLTEVAHERQHYIAVNKKDGRLEQGTFEDDFLPAPDYWTYYADPRPMPKPPEKKEEPKLFVDEFDGTFSLTAEGRRRLERLLRESEGE